MFKFNEIDEFYPTPDGLLDKIFRDIDWRFVETVLEPSAGKGNICDYIARKIKTRNYYNEYDIDCIEIDEDLRKVLTGKGYRVVHDDFLTFNSRKRYSLVVMNPPFSKGSSHLIKALDIVKDGGNLVCILNAETIKNPYTNERKMLLNKLDNLGATIDYYSNEFANAERNTDVEVAVVKIFVEKTKEATSFIWENLKTKYVRETQKANPTDVAVADYIEAAVKSYEMEVEAGINLIKEYEALSPYIQDSLDKDNKYKHSIIELKIGGKDNWTINNYVKLVRGKYWEALFADKRFTGKMTSEQQNDYRNKVRELRNYDFSYYNIKTIQEQMCGTLVKGIEDCIINLFDELSRVYSWNSQTSNNIHYYNGWATNKSWIINKKVILPFYNVWSTYSGEYQPDDYRVIEKLRDIEKALDYLDNGITPIWHNQMQQSLYMAKVNKQTRNIHLKYFDVTFYKKGTMHIVFTNEDLLKKLNIFGSQGKRWLPPSYGKKKYNEMSKEEQGIIDEFEGKVSYENTLANAEYFIYNPKTAVPLLEVM